MRLTSFGMFGNYERETTIKPGIGRNIPTGIIRSQNIKMICGSNHSRHRLYRKSVSFWTSHGNPLPVKRKRRDRKPGYSRYKKDKMPITYICKMAFQHEKGSFKVRLSLPKKLKEYMAHNL